MRGWLLTSPASGCVHQSSGGGTLSASLFFLCQTILLSSGFGTQAGFLFPPQGAVAGDLPLVQVLGMSEFPLLPWSGRTLPHICVGSRMGGFPVPSVAPNICFTSMQDLGQMGFLFHGHQSQILYSFPIRSQPILCLFMVYKVEKGYTTLIFRQVLHAWNTEGLTLKCASLLKSFLSIIRRDSGEKNWWMEQTLIVSGTS